MSLTESPVEDAARDFRPTDVFGRVVWEIVA